MKRKAIFIYLISLWMGVFLHSCTDCGPFPDKYKITDFEVNMGRLNDPEKPLEGFQILTNNAVSYRRFVIAFDGQVATYFSSNWQRWDVFSPLSEALACSPVEPDTDETITDIQVFCDKDFTADYAQNTNIATLFDIVFLADNRLQQMSLPDFMALHPKSTPEFYLLLHTPPDVADTYTFQVKYFQEGVDMDFFTYTTEPVYLSLD